MKTNLTPKSKFALTLATQHTSSTPGPGHSGLGLSIVAACAAAMGARCNATLDIDGANKVLTIEVLLDEQAGSS